MNIYFFLYTYINVSKHIMHIHNCSYTCVCKYAYRKINTLVLTSNSYIHIYVYMMFR